jgi:hypothetical protein
MIARAVAAAMFAGLAVGAASTAWADTTMSGHYVRTQTETRSGRSDTTDWYFTSCGGGCASIAGTPGGQPFAQARVVNGQWTVDTTGEASLCPDGSSVPNAESTHYTWDPNTLAGTAQITIKVPACGYSAGFNWTNSLQLRQAPSSSGQGH